MGNWVVFNGRETYLLKGGKAIKLPPLLFVFYVHLSESRMSRKALDADFIKALIRKYEQLVGYDGFFERLLSSNRNTTELFDQCKSKCNRILKAHHCTQAQLIGRIAQVDNHYLYSIKEPLPYAAPKLSAKSA